MSVPPFFVMPKNVFFSLGLPAAQNTFYQLSPGDLIRQCHERKIEIPNETGTVLTNDGKEAVSIPKEVFIVGDNLPFQSVEWKDINKPVKEKLFDALYQKMIDHLSGQEIWIRDAYFSQDAPDRILIRSINEGPAGDLLVYRMFLQPAQEELTNFNPAWYIIGAHSFSPDTETDGIHQDDFVMVNYAKKVILVGGLPYTAKVKEIIFGILNFALLHERKA